MLPQYVHHPNATYGVLDCSAIGLCSDSLCVWLHPQWIYDSPVCVKSLIGLSRRSLAVCLDDPHLKHKRSQYRHALGVWPYPR